MSITRKRHIGQSLVETALVLPILIGIVLLSLDPFMFAANIGIAKVYSFLASREASIFLANSVDTCDDMARRAVDPPAMFRLNSWEMTFSWPYDPSNPPCPDIVGWSGVSGEEFTVTFSFDMQSVIWAPAGDVWTGQMSTTNVFQ